METINIPNTRGHQKFINQIVQMVKLENLDNILGETKENYDEQYAYVQFWSEDPKQWDQFVALVKQVSEKTYSKINYEV